MRGRLGLTSKKVPLEKSRISEKIFPDASLQSQVRIVLQASSGPVPGVVDVLEGQLERPDVSLRLLHPSWHLGRYQVGAGVGICKKKQFIAISKIFNKALLRHRKHALWSRSNENRSAGFAIVVYFFLARERADLSYFKPVLSDSKTHVCGVNTWANIAQPFGQMLSGTICPATHC